jgi:hypothetical protein
MAAMRNPGDVVSRSYIQREASLARSGGPAISRVDFAVVFDRHVLRQPVENVGPMPADWLSAVSALLRKAAQHRQTE